MHVKLFLIALVWCVATVSAQLFTCQDGVTVCLVGVETCCCPPISICTCCEAVEVCIDNTTCIVPSASMSTTPTQSPLRSKTTTPSQTSSATTIPSPSPSPSPLASASISSAPSASPASLCTQLSPSTVTCPGSLGSTPVILSANISSIAGDLEMTSESVLVLGAPIQVIGGTAVVDGLVQVNLAATDLTGSKEELFAAVITAESMVVANNVTLEVVALPEPSRQCEDVSSSGGERRGAQFGVLLTVDDSECKSTDDGNRRAITAIIIPVVLSALFVLACCVVATVGFVTVMWWYRFRCLLYKNDSMSQYTDQVINHSPRS